VVIMLAGVVSTLLTWPKGEPTQTPWFWLRLLAFPALTWSFLFGLRCLYHDQESARLQAADAALAAEHAKALRFAQEPLAVLGASYVCAMGHSGVAANILGGKGELEARDTLGGDTSVRHTTLAFDGFTQADRFESCFAALLQPLAGALAAIPADVPLDVYVQLPPEVVHEDVLVRWRQCWDTAGHRAVEANVLPAALGTMALDAWLDVRGGPQLERCALFVAIQLHEKPVANSAEAAVALLLGWAPLVARRGLPRQALLHRPVQYTWESAYTALTHALLWGKAEPAHVQAVWQTGVVHAGRFALQKAATDMALGVSSDDASAGIYDIDAAIGQPGIASDWLAIALAVEHVAHAQAPQLAASGQDVLRMAVIQPATPGPQP
jgi:hypothetical protein